MAETSCGNSRIWVVLTGLFLLTSLALAAFISYEKIRDEIVIPDVRQKYPGYFRTPEEQGLVEYRHMLLIERIRFGDGEIYPELLYPVPEVSKTPLGNCSFGCDPLEAASTPITPPGPSTPTFISAGPNTAPPFPRLVLSKREAPYEFQLDLIEFQSYGDQTTMHKEAPRTRTKRSAEREPFGPISYHGCCLSRPKYISPFSAIDIFGKRVELAQFDNLKQYFYSDDCRHTKGCNGCGCSLKPAVDTAVIKNHLYPERSSEEYTIAVIFFPGCCKCLNNYDN